MQHVRRRRVHENETSIPIRDDHAVAHGVQNRLQDPGLFLERRLRACQLVGTLFGRRASFRDTLLQGGVECLQLVLRPQALGGLPLEFQRS